MKKFDSVDCYGSIEINHGKMNKSVLKFSTVAPCPAIYTISSCGFRTYSSMPLFRFAVYFLVIYFLYLKCTYVVNVICSLKNYHKYAMSMCYFLSGFRNCKLFRSKIIPDSSLSLTKSNYIQIPKCSRRYKTFVVVD